MFVTVNSYVAFCCTVIDIFWESTLVFFVTYKPADSGSTEQPWLVQVTLAVSKQILPLLGRIACTECWDVACSYRCSVVCLMDTAMSPAKWLNRDAVWVMDSDGPKEPCQVLAPDPSGKGQFFWGGIHVKTHPVIKCGDWGDSTVENRLTWSTCSLEWSHHSPYPKCHVDWFTYYCRAHQPVTCRLTIELL